VLKIGPSIVVITAPFEHIAAQWLEELKEYSPIMASSSNSNWRKDLAASATSRKLNWINNLIVVAVQKTASSPKFSIEIDKLIPLFSESLFVGDEVHGLGASSYRSAMNDSYNFRLGLSATPERYFDEIGSAAVMTYFEGIVYEFDTKAALAWRDPITGQPALANYKYHPQFVSLNDQEAIEYEELTAQIGAAMGVAGEGQMSSALEKLLFARAAVIKKAASKVPALERIIDELDRNIDYSLIYCHDNEQLLQVAELLLSKGISYQKITGEEDVTPSAKYHGNSERAWILEHFTNGTTKVLLAIRCLDEGVDIPDARLAFILASSGNPREFIQRRGRLLRPGINKEFATIYDFVVAPNIQDSKKIGIEKSVFLKELKRIREFAEDSLNSDQVGTKVATMMLEMEKM
jgi:superfamily II DNA or RNA helicase